MKTRFVINKLNFSQSFEYELFKFLSDEIVLLNENIEYLTIAIRRPISSVDTENGTYLYIKDVGLNFNFHYSYILVDLFWIYKNNILVYPQEEVAQGDVIFWMEGITDHIRKHIKEEFKTKPQPKLIKGYSFIVEAWKWDGVDAMLEIETSYEHVRDIEMQIHKAAENWNNLFEQGKKAHPIHFVGAFKKLGEQLFEIQINTGYCGLPALKYIFKYLDKANIPIEKIEF